MDIQVASFPGHWNQCCNEHVSFQIMVFSEYVSSSGNARSYGSLTRRLTQYFGVFHILNHNGFGTELMIPLYFDDEEEEVHLFFSLLILWSLHTGPTRCF